MVTITKSAAARAGRDERRERLRLLLGDAGYLSKSELARRLEIDRKTIYTDLAALERDIPIEERERLPAHALSLLNQAEKGLMAALGLAVRAEDSDRITRTSRALIELAERRVRVAGLLGLVDLKEANPLLNMLGRTDARTGVTEWALQVVPGLSEEQQAALIKAAAMRARGEPIVQVRK